MTQGRACVGVIVCVWMALSLPMAVPQRLPNWWPKEHHSFSTSTAKPRMVRQYGSSITCANAVS